MVILSASVERFSVSRLPDFFIPIQILTVCYIWVSFLRTGICSELCPFNLVLNPAVTNREEQPLFFQLFTRFFFSFITRKKIQVTLMPLHYTMEWDSLMSKWQ